MEDYMKGRTSVLIMSTLAMMVSFTAWVVLSPIATELQDIYGLSATQKSILIAVPVILGSVFRIPMGILTDKYGGKKVYALTMLFLVIPLVGASFANSYIMLLFWAFLIGMGGTTFAVGIAYVSKWYSPQKQGLILGIVALGNLGTGLAGFIIPTVSEEFGLQWVFWGIAIALVVMTVIFWLGTTELPRTGQAKTVKEALSVLKIKDTWILSLFYFLTFGGFVSFTIYLPTLLQDLFALTAKDAGLRASGFVAIATFIRPLGGYLADRFDPGKVLSVFFIGLAISASIITFMTNNMLLFTVGCLLTAAFVGMGNGAVFKLVPEVAPNNVGAVTGVVGAAGGLGGFFPPIVLGIIKDMTGGYFYGFIFLILFTILCLVTNYVRFNRRTVTKAMAEAK